MAFFILHSFVKILYKSSTSIQIHSFIHSFSINSLYSKIPKRKNSAVSSKLTNKTKVSSSSVTAHQSLNPLNGTSKCDVASKRITSNAIHGRTKIESSPSSSSSPRAKLFSHHQRSQLSSSSSSSANVAALSESNQQQTRRLLDFIQKQKANAQDKRINDNTNSCGGGVGGGGSIYSQPTPKKPLNGRPLLSQDYGIRNGYNGNGDGNGNRKKAQIENNNNNNKTKTNLDNKVTQHPFVPSKRVIQHHDYQNLVDDIKTASPSIANRKRYDNCTYDSVVMGKGYARNNNNNNRKHTNDYCERTKAKNEQSPPIYRHFGDTTNLVRSKAKSQLYNEMNNNNNNCTASSLSIATTEPSTATFDKHKNLIKHQPTESYAEVKRNNNTNNNNDDNLTSRTSDIIPTSYVVTSNLTNDTGFASILSMDNMDTDATSIVTPNKQKSTKSIKTNKFHLPFHCINYNVKNRIKMFDVDPSPYRKHPPNKIHDKRYDTV